MGVDPATGFGYKISDPVRAALFPLMLSHVLGALLW